MLFRSRENSDATVLFHSTMANLLGLHPTDYKVLGILQRLGALSAGEIAQQSGLAPASVTNLIDRLENKIQSLSELAVNRQEPDFISGQVDQVATSMVDTERTINDLQFATGLQPLDEALPSLLERATVKTRR